MQDSQSFKLNWLGAIGVVLLYDLLIGIFVFVFYLPLGVLELKSEALYLMGINILQIFAYLTIQQIVFKRDYNKHNWSKLETNHGKLLFYLSILVITYNQFSTALLQPLLSDIKVSDILVELSEQVINFPLISMFSILIMAPIFEEILFRGIILRGLLKRHNPIFSILLSSLLFGAVHMNWHQFANATLLGFILGYVFYKTGRIRYTIFMHFVMNFSVMFLSFLPATTTIQWLPLIPIALVLVFSLKKISQIMPKDSVYLPKVEAQSMIDSSLID
jgi:membrane protease YdiL (CAAX protease family)